MTAAADLTKRYPAMGLSHSRHIGGYENRSMARFNLGSYPKSSEPTTNYIPYPSDGNETGASNKPVLRLIRYHSK